MYVSVGSDFRLEHNGVVLVAVHQEYGSSPFTNGADFTTINDKTKAVSDMDSQGFYGSNPAKKFITISFSFASDCSEIFPSVLILPKRDWCWLMT